MSFDDHPAGLARVGNIIIIIMELKHKFFIFLFATALLVLSILAFLSCTLLRTNKEACSGQQVDLDVVDESTTQTIEAISSLIESDVSFLGRYQSIIVGAGIGVSCLLAIVGIAVTLAILYQNGYFDESNASPTDLLHLEEQKRSKDLIEQTIKIAENAKSPLWIQLLRLTLCVPVLICTMLLNLFLGSEETRKRFAALSQKKLIMGSIVLALIIAATILLSVFDGIIGGFCLLMAVACGVMVGHATSTILDLHLGQKEPGNVQPEDAQSSFEDLKTSIYVSFLGIFTCIIMFIVMFIA